MRFPKAVVFFYGGVFWVDHAYIVGLITLTSSRLPSRPLVEPNHFEDTYQGFCIIIPVK